MTDTSFPPLEQIGRRICIIGPSNSGKSTLCRTLGLRLGTPFYHLDTYAHVPGTNWVRRPDPDFTVGHDALIAGPEWVMDGNYSVTMAQRFARATGIIFLDPSPAGMIWRYIKRSFLDRKELRFGKIENATHDFSFKLIAFTLRQYPKNRVKYLERLDRVSHAPVLHIRSMRTLGRLYVHWGLDRPS